MRKTIYLCLAHMNHMNHLNLRQWLTYVLNNINTSGFVAEPSAAEL